MNWLTGYGRTLRQYLATPKGRHDARDYSQAVLIILLTMLVALLVCWRGGELLS
jgi:hypothetical protein